MMTPAFPYRLDRDAVFLTFENALRFAVEVATPTNRVRVRKLRPDLDGDRFINRHAWIVSPGSPIPWRDMPPEPCS